MDRTNPSWSNKGRDTCYPVCGMVNIKDIANRKEELMKLSCM